MPIDLFQVALVLVIVILTALLTVIGIEVFYILKDVRKLMDRVNGVLGDAEQVVSNIKKPTEVISSLSHSADILTKLFEVIKIHEQDKKEQPVPQAQEKPMIVEEDMMHHAQPAKPSMQTPPSVSLGRRFFRIPRRPVS